jgi:hypothetical protein
MTLPGGRWPVLRPRSAPALNDLAQWPARHRRWPWPGQNGP